MKKLLTILSVFTISASFSTTVVSCMPQQTEINFDFDPMVGKNIDKSKAIDTSVDPEKHHGVSNFFTLGDSLSDNGGLVTIAKDEVGVNVNIPPDDGKGSNLYNNGFSNGKRVAELINNKLGFDDNTFKPSNLIHSADVEYKNENNETFTAWGRNYSVGGATAYESSGLMSTLLMGNTGIYKQAQAVVKQHQIKETDLFLVEIGGNDLFALADARDNYTQQKNIMKNALENIKNCLLTLVNNGAKRILFITPPDILLTPGYNGEDPSNPDNRYTNPEDKIKINLLTKQFDDGIRNIVNNINTNNENVISIYNLYTNLKLILDGFKTTADSINVNDNFTDSSAFDLGSMDLSNIQIKATVLEKYKEAYLKDKSYVDKFFFIDKVHPTAAGHKYVSNIVWDLLKDKNLINE
ncbi:SGNH/GDSL hydrolase family protein [Spiroplasma turonicum]|uniref:Lipolytic enzyme, GDSL family n=1 Tax=Spiroplasma turonicum TaxID=216946 RepID=A0A0K1P649_9MOLU|nr:SGNH/GDSL hydrolase family protein [Spiroplasma turonicum]AKU79776.1 lipolytic enzyme, GDSL family [Spiroplasma turonicum]ALX70794.1 lipolytic enzyme, GDSL family [Spiroplasma turonicum]